MRIRASIFFDLCDPQIILFGSAAGMFNATPDMLPQSFTMCTLMLSYGFWMQQRYAHYIPLFVFDYYAQYVLSMAVSV